MTKKSRDRRIEFRKAKNTYEEFLDLLRKQAPVLKQAFFDRIKESDNHIEIDSNTYFALNMIQIKEGSIVTAENYSGELVVEELDEYGTSLLGVNHWFCRSAKYDTHFDTYSEKELTLVR